MNYIIAFLCWRIVRALGMSSEDEMAACLLGGELTSRRFGRRLRSQLAAAGWTERLPTHHDLVCLEGQLRLTAHALAGFPTDIECLIGTAPTMGHWTQ